MGLLQRLFGGQQSAEPTPQSVFTLVPGPCDLEVVGESHYQEALRAIAPRSIGRVRANINAILYPEPRNPYDPNAISVWIDGRKVGHLSREDAAAIRPGLLRLQAQTRTWIALPGVIASGSSGMFGVFLNWDPSPFGLGGVFEREYGGSSTVRTGRAAAVRSDGSDDGLVTIAPFRTVQEALPLAVRQLERIANPVKRHFLYASLEDELYARRDEPGALEAFDQACAWHDNEMPQVRPALLAEFGNLPRLQLYHQAAIRHQKAHNWAAALAWAERGLAIYGRDALGQENIDDLARRAEKYRSKLAMAVADKA